MGSSLEGPTWWLYLGAGFRLQLPGSKRNYNIVAHSQCVDDKPTSSSEQGQPFLAQRSEGDFSHAVFNRESSIKSFPQYFLGSDVPALGWLSWHLRMPGGPHPYIIGSCLGNTGPLGNHHSKFCQKYIPSVLLFM